MGSCGGSLLGRISRNTETERDVEKGRELIIRLFGRRKVAYEEHSDPEVIKGYPNL